LATQGVDNSCAMSGTPCWYFEQRTAYPRCCSACTHQRQHDLTQSLLTFIIFQSLRHPECVLTRSPDSISATRHRLPRKCAVPRKCDPPPLAECTAMSGAAGAAGRDGRCARHPTLFEGVRLPHGRPAAGVGPCGAELTGNVACRLPALARRAASESSRTCPRTKIVRSRCL